MYRTADPEGEVGSLSSSDLHRGNPLHLREDRGHEKIIFPWNGKNIASRVSGVFARPAFLTGLRREG